MNGRDSSGCEPAIDRLTVVIVAGSSGPPVEPEGWNKNFLVLRGRPVVQRQLDLVGSMPFARRVLVTEPEHLPEVEVPPGTLVVPASRSQSENFARVKAAVEFGEHDRCLLLFGDTPLVTPGMVRDFVRRCELAPADFHHGLVPFAFAGPFMDYFPRPHQGRRPFHVREFLARLGCLSLVRPARFDPEATRKAIRTVMRGRKQDPEQGGLVSHLRARARVLWGGLRFIGPLGVWIGACAILAHWLHQRGFPKGARMARRPVTLGRLDAVATKLFGCSSRFVACPFGAASLDIDSRRDLEVHERYLDQMERLTALQERLAVELVDPALELTPEGLRRLERFDPEAAAEIKRHPEVYREQQRILLEAERAVQRGASHAA